MTEQLPPGPWTWQRIHPGVSTPVPEDSWGHALVAGDGTWLISASDGWGRPDIHPALRGLLERLRPDDEQKWWAQAQAENAARAEDGPPPRHPLRSSYGKLSHLSEELSGWDIAAVRADLTRQAEASLGEHHPEDEPANCAEATLHELADAKLTGAEREATLFHGLRAVAELGKQLRKARDRRSHIFEVDPTRQMGPPFLLRGPQVEGLEVGMKVYVTDTSEEAGDVTVFECEVSEVRSDGVVVEEQPRPVRGFTDCHFLHLVEERGTRTYLILVADGKAAGPGSASSSTGGRAAPRWTGCSTNGKTSGGPG